MRPLCLIGVVLALAFASPAAAITPTITEFSGGLSSTDNPLDIAGGPDANLWFTDAGGGRALGLITSSRQISKFTAGLGGASSPRSITAAPDGDLWFTDDGSPPAIGQLATSGAIQEFSAGLDSNSVPDGIAAGPDGNVWFADHGSTPAIGRVTPSGAIHEFALPAGSSPKGVAGGPDGNVWFTDGGSTPAIGRITPAGAVHEFSAGLSPGSAPAYITAGPDGNLWFTDDGTIRAIGRITPAGAITEFTGLGATSHPMDIASGSDGALWFTDQGTNPAIGRALTNGAITEWDAGLPSGSKPSGIAAGPDGNVWFTDDSGNAPAIGFITTPPATTTVSASATGATTAAVLGLVDGHAQSTRYYVEYGTLGGSLSATGGRKLGSTVGPTHVTIALNRLRPNTTYQARMVGVNGTDSTPGGFVTFTTAPPADRITRMRLRPKRFVAARRGATVRSRSSRAPGALISYTGSQPATTRFTVERAVQGRRHRKNCVKRTHRNRKAKRCTLLVTVGRFTHKDAAGHIRFRFTGRLHHRTLKPGNYRLNAEPHSAGGVGRVVHKSFSIKARPHKRHKKKRG